MMTNQNARRIRLIIWVKILPKVRETKAQKGGTKYLTQDCWTYFYILFFPSWFVGRRAAWLRKAAKSPKNANSSMEQNLTLSKQSANRESIGECVENMVHLMAREVILLLVLSILTVILITVLLVVISRCSWLRFWWVLLQLETNLLKGLLLKIHPIHMCCMTPVVTTQRIRHCLLCLKMGSPILNFWSLTHDLLTFIVYRDIMNNVTKRNEMAHLVAT